MNSTFQSNFQTGVADSALPILLFESQDEGLQLARVGPGQQLLFPSSPRSVCDEIGLNWQTALRSQEEGWLSFSLESVSQLDEAQEAELRFVGALLLAGCDRKMLGLLLAGLPGPYAYDLKRLYFDWTTRHWHLLPDVHANPESAFTDWIEQLVQNRDVASLVGIVELAQDALSRVRRASGL